ncbi:MAG: AAA family ATPase [Bacteroidota bacterium]
MKRVMIIGCSGSGKSTLAGHLGQVINLPVIHLDQHYFSSGWSEPSTEDWRRRIMKLVQGERWVMDGNYASTFDLRMPHADTIIYVDLPSWQCLCRVINRTIRYHGEVRPSSAPGCPERFDLEFFHYVISYNFSRRPGILRRLDQEKTLGKQIIHLKGSRDVSRWAIQVQKTNAT